MPLGGGDHAGRQDGPGRSRGREERGDRAGVGALLDAGEDGSPGAGIPRLTRGDRGKPGEDRGKGLPQFPPFPSVFPWFSPVTAVPPTPSETPAPAGPPAVPAARSPNAAPRHRFRFSRSG